MDKTSHLMIYLRNIKRFSCFRCLSNQSQRLRPTITKPGCSVFVASKNGRISSISSVDKIMSFTRNLREIHIQTSSINFTNDVHTDLSSINFEQVCNLTLDALAEFLDSLADEGICHEDFDVQLVSGVLTIKIGGDVGTYVINKQTPNQQIWLSSPISGPKRYDLVDNCRWIYSHDGVEMNKLLSKEFSEIFQRKVKPSDLAYDVEDVG